MKNYVFGMFFGRTELIIGVSKAKECGESAGGVGFGVAPQKPRKNAEKSTKKLQKIFLTSKNKMLGMV